MCVWGGGGGGQHRCNATSLGFPQNGPNIGLHVVLYGHDFNQISILYDARSLTTLHRKSNMSRTIQLSMGAQYDNLPP